MSTIEEIRKRVEGWAERRSSRVSVAEFEAEADQAQQDRATLLAALDGEWQSERPTPGPWRVSIRPEIRRGFPSVVDCEVFRDSSGLVVQYKPGGDLLPLDQDWFTGALWQRRTVPGDPFSKGGE